MGKGTDPNGKKDSAASLAQRCSFAQQDRGLVPPNGESELSAHDYAFGLAASGDDHSLLSRLVSDVVHRLAVVHGIDIFDFQLLPRIAARIISAKLASRSHIFAVPHGARNRPQHHQHQGCARGAYRQRERICANAQIQRHFQAG